MRCAINPWPHINVEPGHQTTTITQGQAGVYSSFLKHAERAAERYGVPAHEILSRVGKHGYVGGQEDMIIDVALELLAEQSDPNMVGAK